MNLRQRLLFVSALCFGLATTSLEAQQIRQPASVLPWRAPAAEVTLVLKDPRSGDESAAPAWLVDSAAPLPKPARQPENLPMVERERFAHLGELQAGSDRSRSLSVQPSPASSWTDGKPLRWLRSLGVQASRPGSRR